jgi:hypothetical protein
MSDLPSVYISYILGVAISFVDPYGGSSGCGSWTSSVRTRAGMLPSASLRHTPKLDNISILLLHKPNRAKRDVCISVVTRLTGWAVANCQQDPTFSSFIFSLSHPESRVLDNESSFQKVTLSRSEADR